MSKPKLQARMAALSFTEKIKILEKLRDRELAIAKAGLRKDRAEEEPLEARQESAEQGRRKS